MKTLFTALSLGLALSAPAMAQDHAAHGHHGSASTTTAAPADTASQATLTAGEITRVDARTGKLTIRHGEIKNLDMPPMTMVFALQDSGAQPSQFKPGDKVLFQAEERSGALVITRIQAAL